MSSMSCERCEAELPAFHFGEVSDDERRAIEEHLLSCPQCLREYLEVKRAIETAEHEPAPSPLLRQRLRRAVSQELGISAPWSWWERPLALASAALVVLAAMSAVHAVASSPGTKPHAAQNG